MVKFEQHFLAPSIDRRRTLIAQKKTPPNDVLTKLLQQDQCLPDHILRREIAFYLQAGAHSTANSTTHAIHEILTWIDGKSERRRLFQDKRMVQKAVHESLRLHPASPVAWRKPTSSIQLSDRTWDVNDRIVINLHAANRDRSVFGEDADLFNPDRTLPGNVWPYGLSFGYGVHFCMGSRLAELQLRILWEEILQRFERVEVQAEPSRTFSSFVNGYTELPVTVIRK